MTGVKRAGLPIVGILFFALGLLKLVRGEHWVVWILLGVVFGGLGVFRRRPEGRIEP